MYGSEQSRSPASISIPSSRFMHRWIKIGTSLLAQAEAASGKFTLLNRRHIMISDRGRNGNDRGDGSESKRGFASMDEAKQREIASKGGKAAHEKGTAHEFTSEEARAAGRKGGEARGRGSSGGGGSSSTRGGTGAQAGKARSQSQKGH